MGLERFDSQLREVVDRYVDPGASLQLTAVDQVVRASTTTASITLTLPSVAEAKGRTYSVVARLITGSYTVTIQDQDDSEYSQNYTKILNDFFVF